jgi:phage replication-related protein YjqB (UPF0714/DUF867 family)
MHRDSRRPGKIAPVATLLVGPRFVPDARTYQSFQDLALTQQRDVDFRIHVRTVSSSGIAIIAPHGGEIEDGTSALTRAIAGQEHNLYLFEGLRPSHNYRALHLTSHRFDEPECLALLANCDHVVAVHGCRGTDEQIFLGGLDDELKRAIALRLRRSGLRVHTDGHAYPAVQPLNICNRGRRLKGVQLEITQSLRHPPAADAISAAVRDALDAVPAPTGAR